MTWTSQPTDRSLATTHGWTVQVLLEDAGLVSVESEGKKRTPLLIAARAGRRDVVECVSWSDGQMCFFV